CITFVIGLDCVQLFNIACQLQPKLIPFGGTNVVEQISQVWMTWPLSRLLHTCSSSGKAKRLIVKILHGILLTSLS
ncbi:hypothetical protein GBAR_LOCUS3698, partial [Geodia barretti]